MTPFDGCLLHLFQVVVPDMRGPVLTDTSGIWLKMVYIYVGSWIEGQLELLLQIFIVLMKL